MLPQLSTQSTTIHPPRRWRIRQRRGNHLHNLTSKTDAKGQTISYSYDANNRLLRKNYPDGTEETFSYDSKGNILTAANKNISYSFSYDIAGRMLTATDSTGQVIQYGYDSAGRKTGLTYPDGTNAAYSYDNAGRLAKITSNGKAYSFSYDSLGRRTKLGYPNGASASYSYDSTGKLTSLSHKAALGLPIDSFSYTHDKAGNRLSIKQLLQTITYSYDPLYRLTQAKPALPLGSTEQYSYDPVGNRISGPKPTLRYLHNQANQLTEETGNTTGILAELFGQTAIPTGKASYSYDQNGNLITKTEPTGLPNSPVTTHYNYDFENRLIQTEIKFGQATVTTSFSYDPFGRRISKKTTGTWCLLNGTDSHSYTYDGQNIILEQRDTNITGADFTGTTRYLHGPGTDEPLSLTRGSNSWYYHADGLGSIIALSNKYGIVIDKIDYDSFGNRKVGIHLISQPYSYTGREWDKETGLYYYRARYYDPSVGRFVQKDPIGFGGGINVYAYVKSNPINAVDPTGLHPWSDYCHWSANVVCGTVWRFTGSVISLKSDCCNCKQVSGSYIILGGTSAGIGAYATTNGTDFYGPPTPSGRQPNGVVMGFDLSAAFAGWGRSFSISQMGELIAPPSVSGIAGITLGKGFAVGIAFPIGSPVEKNCP